MKLASFLVLFVAASFSFGCGSATQVSNVAAEVAEPLPNGCGDRNESAIDFDGVKLECRLPGRFRLLTFTEPAVELKNKDDKPDSIHPRFTAIEFDASDGFSFINVYPVEEFKEIARKSTTYGPYVERSFALLDKFLEAKTPAKSEIPTPIYVDGSFNEIGKRRFIQFRNGSGVLYLAQHSTIEPTLILNDRIRLMFQGLTNDQRYYVVAFFATKSNKLKELNDGYERTEDLPANYYESSKFIEIQKNYETYVAKISSELDAADADTFTPNPDSVAAMLETLAIEK